MHRLDLRLHPVGAETAGTVPTVFESAQQGESLGDLVSPPAPPVLVFERNQVSGGVHPGIPAGVLEEHQGEQRDRFGVGQQVGRPAG